MKIHYVIYPDMTLLDLVGPVQIWNNFPDLEVCFVAKTLDPVKTDSGMIVTPSHSFAEVTDIPDILFVPGGTLGTAMAAQDAQTLAFVREQGEHAGWVTSVCTGAIILGAAGLLDGYNAATHWAAMEFLPNFGAKPVDQRYVIDRNRATGGGVTAGIDFGLALMAEISGEQLAQMSQLSVEYTPAPPFTSGHPREASDEIMAAVTANFTGIDELFGSIKQAT